jgi:hypothetical protein
MPLIVERLDDQCLDFKAGYSSTLVISCLSGAKAMKIRRKKTHNLTFITGPLQQLARVEGAAKGFTPQI